ncbi:MAG: exonuclease domain-containing protein [Bacteroidota bacterium]
MSKLYAIIDIETTGGKAQRHRITEIAIVLHDGQQVIDQWESLLDPEMPIPYGITQLTGITQEMVQGKPKFYEVAKKIVEMTQGAIFVAHNVRFDYGFIREEFKRLGYTYTRKQLCTVRLSRQAFPGLKSYSLGKLIKHFKIKVNGRHRAMADTLATVQLLEKILAKKESEDQIQQMINLGIRESLLPKNLNLEQLHALPEHCGVYYFHDEKGRLAYVGKSINIKKRVAEHFSKVTEKARKLQKFVHEVSYENMGSELVALLYESHLIKRHRPYINRAQRVRHFPYVIHTFKDQQGYINFETAKPLAAERKKLCVVGEYPKMKYAKRHLDSKIKKWNLCTKLCGIERNSTFCFDYHLKQCQGACGAIERAEEYNLRAKEALEEMSNVFERDFVVIDEGRNEQERSIVLVEDGEYCGFGYIDAEESISTVSNLRHAVTAYESNPEVKRIIRGYLDKNPNVKVIYF